MWCGGCGLAVKEVLERLDGVASAKATVQKGAGRGVVLVHYDPAKIAPETMLIAIREVGFKEVFVRPTREQ